VREATKHKRITRCSSPTDDRPPIEFWCSTAAAANSKKSPGEAGGKVAPNQNLLTLVLLSALAAMLATLVALARILLLLAGLVLAAALLLSAVPALLILLAGLLLATLAGLIVLAHVSCSCGPIPQSDNDLGPVFVSCSELKPGICLIFCRAGSAPLFKPPRSARSIGKALGEKRSFNKSVCHAPYRRAAMRVAATHTAGLTRPGHTAKPLSVPV
jgi:hypothetical protein